MPRPFPVASCLAVAGLLACASVHAVQRSFVASFGNDANTAANCTFASPCRSFTAAQTVTDSGGEIVALDAAGYGAITITKSLSLIGNPGFYAGISASAGSAVTIDTSNVNVILRGLNINGVGGTIGVNMTNGNSLTIENCVISNFGTAGVKVSNPASVRISDSTARGNYHGIYALGGATVEIFRSRLIGNFNGMWISNEVATTTTTATLSDSEASHNAYGSVAGFFGTGAARVAISRSTLSNNGGTGVYNQAGPGVSTTTISGSLVTTNDTGLYNVSGTLESQGNNTVRQNQTNTSGPITAFAGT